MFFGVYLLQEVVNNDTNSMLIWLLKDSLSAFMEIYNYRNKNKSRAAIIVNIIISFQQLPIIGANLLKLFMTR